MFQLTLSKKMWIQTYKTYLFTNALRHLSPQTRKERAYNQHLHRSRSVKGAAPPNAPPFPKRVTCRRPLSAQKGPFSNPRPDYRRLVQTPTQVCENYRGRTKQETLEDPNKYRPGPRYADENTFGIILRLADHPGPKCRAKGSAGPERIYKIDVTG